MKSAITQNRIVYPRKSGFQLWKAIKKHALIISTVLAAIIGFGFGVAIRQAHPSKNVLIWLGKPFDSFTSAFFFGMIFLRRLCS